jgi:hypothetical protein
MTLPFSQNQSSGKPVCNLMPSFFNTNIITGNKRLASNYQPRKIKRDLTKFVPSVKICIFQISEGQDAVKIANCVQKLANYTLFFGHELQDVMQILGSIFELHMHQIQWEYPAIRLNKSIILTTFASGVLDKLLESKLGLQQLDEVSVLRLISR